MMTETISNYKLLINNISKLIDISGYRNDYIAKKLGLKPQTFSLKKQRANWEPDEVEKLLAIIENDDTEDYLLGLLMTNMNEDEVLSLDEFKQQVGWK